jgi:hypothetical protein
MKPIIYMRWGDSHTGHQIDRTEAAKMIRNMRRRRHSARPNERTEVTFNRATRSTYAAVPWARISAHFSHL